MDIRVATISFPELIQKLNVKYTLTNQRVLPCNPANEQFFHCA